MVFVTGFLHRVMFSDFILVVANIRISFLWLNTIPLYKWTTFCLPISQLMDIWVIPTLWPLGTMLCGHLCISLRVHFQLSWVDT